MFIKILIAYFIIYCAIDSNKKIDKDTKNELFVNIVLYSFDCLFLYGICTQIYNEKIKYQGYVYAFPDDKATSTKLIVTTPWLNLP